MLFFFLFVLTECDKDFDLVFVIDGSGSIEQAGKGNFDLIKNFVKSVIGGFRIGFDNTHVGVLIFSSSQYVKVIFGLETYYSTEPLNNAIDAIRYPSGGTYTAKALRIARTQILTSSQDRDDKPNVVIVVTDGKATDSGQLDGAASALRSQETTIIAVGVGENYERSELERMAGNPRNVYTADFKDLRNVIEQIKQSACQGRVFSHFIYFSFNPEVLVITSGTPLCNTPSGSFILTGFSGKKSLGWPISYWVGLFLTRFLSKK